jgi:phage internal scaffolding protein
MEKKAKLPWDHPDNAKERSDTTATINNQPSLTQQGMAEQADINWIVRNFMPTAIPQNVRQPMYGDFTGITDYRTALEQVASARNSFMQMPAELRAKLDQDPQKFIDWCADPKNLEEMRALGLAVPAAQPDTNVKPKDDAKAA